MEGLLDMVREVNDDSAIAETALVIWTAYVELLGKVGCCYLVNFARLFSS